MLAEANIDIYAKNNAQMTALQMASAKGFFKSVEVLLSKNIQVSKLKRNGKNVSNLFQKMFRSDHKKQHTLNKSLIAALMEACKEHSTCQSEDIDFLKVIQFLCDAGADVTHGGKCIKMF